MCHGLTDAPSCQLNYTGLTRTLPLCRYEYYSQAYCSSNKCMVSALMPTLFGLTCAIVTCTTVQGGSVVTSSCVDDTKISSVSAFVKLHLDITVKSCDELSWPQCFALPSEDNPCPQTCRLCRSTGKPALHPTVWNACAR